MAERNWTTEQKQCLDATGTVLVSAAAGSGKTAVLVERIIRLLCDADHPVDVDELLVVTFTKAAAAEMKQRLSAALTRALQEHPNDRRLRRQLMLLPGAAISTVHGFCSDLVREHFHRLPDVSPVFRVAEETQTAPLRAEALNELLEERYAAHDPSFERLVELLGGVRDDRQLADRVESLYKFVQSDPDPDHWLATHAAPYHEALPVGQTPWGREILRLAADTSRRCERLYCRALALIDADAPETAGYHALLTDELAQTQQLVALCTASDWDGLYQRVNSLTFDRFPRLKKGGDAVLHAQLIQQRNTAKSKLVTLSKLLMADEKTISADTAHLAPAMDELFALVRLFSERYTAKKRQLSYLDFNDLEHLTLALLLTRDAEGNLRRTSLAEEVGRRYAYVMVDEYQDTNPTQEQIFRAVSREEQNLFFVGDVKQSIYAFRNATPELFIARRDRYPAFDGTQYPATIRLGNNFRSRRSVTDTVNFCFDQLMTRATCGVDYTDGEELVCSAVYPDRADDAAELLLFDGDALSPGDNATAAEARGIAARIEEMMGTMTVSEGDGERPLRCGDICILMRSVKGCAGVFIDELGRRGIPAVCGAGSGFFETPEIAFTLSLLRFLDNPLQDVALLAVLLSPVFAFTPDEAAALRADRGHAPLYVSLRRGARGDDALAARCRAFLQKTDRLRTAAAVSPADRLLTRVYEELSLPAVMRVRRHGEQRVANLQQLLDMARQFEQNGYRGLSAFLRTLDRQMEQDDPRPAPVAGSEDAVRIMTIHGSKGLEFPVVFLAGLGRKFNIDFLRDPLPLHRELGAGMKFLDMVTLEKRDTLQRQAIIARIRRDARAEDLRVLYVAMTRARERLCLVMTGNVPGLLTDAAALLPDTASSGGETALPAEAVTEAASPALWILAALLRHPDAASLRRMAGVETLPPLPCDARLDVRLLAPPAPPETDIAPAPVASVAPDGDYLHALHERVDWRYPYAALSEVPVKLAVSELSHRTLHEHFIATARPAFFSETQLSPAERGTALHQFMQYADYAAAADDLPTEVRRLVRGGFLTAEQGASLPLPRLAAFFDGALYDRIQNATQVWREYAFTMERPAADCVPDLTVEQAAGEQVLLQGIADCVFEENGQLVIVDYKTDHVKTPEELAERYRAQLALYAEALSVVLERPVAERLLYSFALQRTVSV